MQAQRNAQQTKIDSINKDSNSKSDSELAPALIAMDVPTIDYTPAHLITLLFTDMG
jgi:translation initiation factor 2B subunit (eIF-2B alpha/beta/delta family)